MNALVLRLYVAGDAPNSAAALLNLRAVLAELPAGAAKVEVIDVLKDPARGQKDGVLVTPTLVKGAPRPERRIVGDLRDRSLLARVLGLEAGRRE